MKIRSVLYNIYWKLTKVLAPTLRSAQEIYVEILTGMIRSDIDWLDLGCGHHIFPQWKLDQEQHVVSIPRFIVGLDYSRQSLQKHKTIRHKIQGHISSLPFSNDCFDFVTANMVFEHLDNPQQQLKEIGRVLRKGGLLLFHTPNAWSYTVLISRIIPEALKAPLISLLEGRRAEDVFPTFYRANCKRAIYALAEKTGFRVRQFRYLVTDAHFALVPPLAVVELLWIRLLMAPFMTRWRTNLVVCLEKQ